MSKYRRGLKIPADLTYRIRLSYERHGARLRALKDATQPDLDNSQYLTGAADDQGQCGDCWNFSGTNTAADAAVFAGLQPVTANWSKQCILDCGQNGGCNGDWPETALAQIKATGTADTQAYPYTGGSGVCQTNVPTPNKIVDYGYVGDSQGVPATQAIKNALVAHGTLSIAVDASAFDNYSGGIMTGPPFTNIDHAIRLYGWHDYQPGEGRPAGSTATGYWLAQNQWGLSWGESGKLRIEYGAYGIGFGAMFAIATTPTPVPPSPVVPPVPPAPPSPPSPPAPPVPPAPTTLTGTTAPYSFVLDIPIGHSSQTVTIPALPVTVSIPATRSPQPKESNVSKFNSSESSNAHSLLRQYVTRNTSINDAAYTSLLAGYTVGGTINWSGLLTFFQGLLTDLPQILAAVTQIIALFNG